MLVAQKLCPRCDTVKEASAFYTYKGRLSWACRPCKVAHVRTCRLRNPRTRLIRQEEYRKYAHKHRNGMLQRLYGIDSVIYESMLTRQGGTCAICLEAPTRKDKFRLAVDHNHAGGSIRGLLCTRCNTGLGGFRDTPELLRAAARYLER